MSIAGKVVAITGASSGIGRATAILLAEAGATVVLGARREDILAEVARDITAVGGKVAYKQTDVRVRADLDALVALAVERGGRLDVIVNNAGISTTAEISGAEALKVFDTNAIGLIRVTQAALPLLEKSENPVVVNVSSALGSFWAVTNPERRQFHFPAIVYGSSKAAVSMLTVQYAKAMPQIKFNAVEPGFTATELTPFSGAGQPVEKGAEVIVRMATIGRDGPTGTFQEDTGELAW